MRGRSFAMARTSAATYSAIGWSKTPRAFVTTVSESASSGHIRWSTPALAVCTQRGRGPSPGHARSSAREAKSQIRRASAVGSSAASVLSSAYSTRTRPVSRPSRGGGSEPSTSSVGFSAMFGNRGGGEGVVIGEKPFRNEGPLL